jgi:excisionase family DNA binding protein
VTETEYADAARVARMLGFSERTIRAMARQGRLAGAARIGRTWRFHLPTLRASLHPAPTSLAAGGPPRRPPSEAELRDATDAAHVAKADAFRAYSAHSRALAAADRAEARAGRAPPKERAARAEEARQARAFAERLGRARDAAQQRLRDANDHLRGLKIAAAPADDRGSSARVCW